LMGLACFFKFLGGISLDRTHRFMYGSTCSHYIDTKFISCCVAPLKYVAEDLLFQLLAVTCTNE
jgi:hypothetical protein